MSRSSLPGEGNQPASTPLRPFGTDRGGLARPMAQQVIGETFDLDHPAIESPESLRCVDDLRRLLIELLQPLPGEVDVEHFITGLGSLGMASGLGGTSLGGSQRSRAAQAPVHQGERSSGDQRKADQVNSSQKVVQGLGQSFPQPSVKKC